MKRPIFVRPLSDAERETLEAGLRSPDAFPLRRCQILLASSRGENAYQIAHQLGCNPQTARNAIHAFNEKGLPEALQPGSKHPHTVHRAFQDREQAEALREMLHRSPREFGRESSLWTLEMAAEVAFEEGLVERPISGETIRATLVRLLGIRWTRAKRWITSADPLYERKKAARSTDGSGPGQSRQLGGWFLGRVLVESAGLAHFEQLERAGKPSSSAPEVGRQRRSRAEGHLLLRTLCAPTRPDVDQVRGWEAHQFHNDAIPFVEPAKAPRGGKESYGPHLGQRQLAHLQRGQALARKTQPPGQREWRRSKDRKLLVAQTEPVAERHRTQVDTRQAQSGRARRRGSAGRLRARREGLPGLRLSALRASVHYRE